MQICKRYTAIDNINIIISKDYDKSLVMGRPEGHAKVCGFTQTTQIDFCFAHLGNVENPKGVLSSRYVTPLATN
jgi:hypothetical protein